MGYTNDQISDFENTSIFPRWEKLDSVSGLASFPFGQGTMPASAFERFSPSHNLITQYHTLNWMLSR
ncbi:hypothetical protein ACFLT2_11420 [Acidobacteriota bacterium]